MNKGMLVFILSSIVGVFPTIILTEGNAPKKIIKETHSIPPFDAVKLVGIGNIFITQSDKQNFTIEAEDKILPLIQVSVTDNVLTIEPKATKDNPIEEGTKINYYLNIKDLKSVDLSGTTGIFIPDGLTTNELKLTIDSDSDSNIKLNVKKLITKISGGGKMVAEGTAEDQTVSISGATTFTGQKLVGKSGTFTIKGAGAITTGVTDTLGIEISGLGEVKYCGKPTITKKVSGTGAISPLPAGECAK